jgi:hypothetical protein
VLDAAVPRYPIVHLTLVRSAQELRGVAGDSQPLSRTYLGQIVVMLTRPIQVDAA